MSYKNELKKGYKNAISAFINAFPLITSKMIAEIDNYCRTCAIYLWAYFSVPSSSCVDCLNVICYDEDNSKIYTKKQVDSIMQALITKKYSVRIPQFFLSVIDFDKDCDTYYSRLLADCFGFVFLEFALIDDLITYEEAKKISSIHKSLIKKCDDEGVERYESTFNAFDFVSGRINDRDKKSVELFVYEKEPNIDSNEELNKLIGLKNVKEEVNEIRDFLTIQQERKLQGLPVSSISYHLVFTGNPGTGKTTVARIIARLYKELHVVSKGQLIEATSKDLVAGYVGQTAIKTHEVIQKAIGGVLFIDEAYTLKDSDGQGYGQEAIDTLLKEMEDNRNDLAVIVAGYDDLMNEFIHSNPGLESRFNRYIHFDDYSSEEMFNIFKLMCSNNAYSTNEQVDNIMRGYFEYLYNNHGDNFANARTVRNIFENIISKQATRIAAVKNKTHDVLLTITEEDTIDYIGQEKEESLEEILASLNDLVGLENVKNTITDYVYVMKTQQKRKTLGLKNAPLSLHLVFTGNPGTGKTTVARCVAKIYKQLGFLSKGQLIEVDRSGLVAGYVGQTAIKTKEVIKSALGGVLFIDEAYTLSNNSSNDYGQEAIDTILKAMEDNRDNFAVIIAGYSELMSEFISSNPGLESRFNKYIHFDDYSSEEMNEIFIKLANNNQYVISDEAKSYLHNFFNQTVSSSIGNGRGVRNIFENVVIEQSKRIALSSVEEDLSLIIEDDVRKALDGVGQKYE